MAKTTKTPPPCKWRIWAGAATLFLLAGNTVPGQAPSGETLLEIQAKAYQSDPAAQNALGNAYTGGTMGLPQDFAEALKWYVRAAKQGFPQALFNLGLAYELGRGVPPDAAVAFQHYRQAAEKGYATAQFNVANMYASGRGVTQDLFEAVLWYRQAAEQGLVEAQFNLGLAYETGQGVQQDAAFAARWYQAAAAQDFPLAQYNLGLLLEDGRGVTRDETAAARLYRAAAGHGVAQAQNNYGLMLLEGRGGLAADPVEAFVWLNLAVQNGVPPTARDLVAEKLTREQQAAAQHLLEQRRAETTAADPARKPVLTAAESRRNSTGPQDEVQALRKKNSELERWVQSLELALKEEKPRGNSTPILERFGLEPRVLSRNDELVQEISRFKEELELSRKQTGDARAALRALRQEYERQPTPSDESSVIVKLRSELLGAQYHARELETRNAHLERWVQLLERHLAEQNTKMAALQQAADSTGAKQ